MLTEASAKDQMTVPADGAWPAEVRTILSALEAAPHAAGERRRLGRKRYQVRAALRLFTDLPDAPPRELYTREANQRGMGFITPHRLPLGYGGVIELSGPDGQTLAIHCTILRCRETVSGWYEGAVYFNREQWAFAVEA